MYRELSQTPMQDRVILRLPREQCVLRAPHNAHRNESVPQHLHEQELDERLGQRCHCYESISHRSQILHALP